MAWYKAGTVSCAQNSSTVTGQSTDFAANCRVGDAFIGPDGRWYEIVNVPSASVLAIDPAYAGASIDAGRYSVMPVQGYNRDSATALRQATKEFTEGTAGASESAAQAEQSATKASQSQKAAETAATTATQKAGVAETAASTASQQAQGAASSRQAADTSAGTAVQSASDAKGYRDQAAQSAASIDTSKLVNKNGDTLAGALNWATRVDMADSATPAIGAAASNSVNLIGSTTITGFDALASGVRMVRFNASRTLKHDATKLELVGGADIVTAAGDTAVFEAKGAVWRMVSYQRAANTPALQTQTSTDATVGRLMRVGDFGMSAYGIALAASVDLNGLATSGRYTCGGGNNPNAPTLIGYLDVIAHAAGNICKQIWYEFYGQGIWTRYCQNGTWGAWTPMFHRGNVVGSVSSDSSGVPTGSIIEQGSNSNGAYVRFADGTQICWSTRTFSSIPVTTASGSVFYHASGIGSLSMPATFSTAPTFSLNVKSNAGLTWATVASDGDVSTFPSFFAMNPTSATLNLTAQLKAVGRWR